MRKLDSSMGVPSVSSIRTRSSSVQSDGRLTSPKSFGDRNVVRSPPRRVSMPFSPLSVNSDMNAIIGDIGKEAKELAAKMSVELAQIRGSVDLRAQTDRALLMSADKHFHNTARMWIAYFKQQSVDRHFDPNRPDPVVERSPPDFHFVPMPTGPQLTLRLQESRSISASMNQRKVSEHKRFTSGGASSQPGEGIVDDPRRYPEFRAADFWCEDGGGVNRANSSSVNRRTIISPASELTHPRWNVSTQLDPEVVADPQPLSVVQTTKEWLSTKKDEHRRQSPVNKSGTNRGGAEERGRDQQRRTLRFESPDGVVTAGSSFVNRDARSKYRDPVRSSLLNESMDRVNAPTSYGRSTTGLWSQRNADADRHASRNQVAFASSTAADTASAQESKQYYATLGDVGSRAIGLKRTDWSGSGTSAPLNVSMSDDEAFARRQLQEMNMDIAPLHSGAMNHPILSGIVLCRLVNVIVRQFLPRQQLKEIPVRCRAGMSFDDVKANYVSALTRIREFIPPSGAEPVPPRLLYIDPREVLAGNVADVWSLIAKLFEVFVLKFDRNSVLNAQQQQRNVNGGAASSPHQQQRIPILGRYCEAYAPRHMMLLETSVCNFLYALHVLVEPSQHALPPDDHLTAPIPGPLQAPFLPDKRFRWHVRTTPLSSISLPSVFPFLTNGTILCDVVNHVLDLDIPVYRNPRVRANCISNIRAAQDTLLKYYPNKISNMFLCDPNPVFEGDKAFILLLIEDIIRFTAKAAPRKVLPGPDQSPFLLPDAWNSPSSNAAVQAAYGQSGSAGGGAAHSNKDMPFNPDAANASHVAQFVQPERQAFVTEPPIQPKWTLAELAVQREGSVGSQASVGSSEIPTAAFTSSKANPPPKVIQLRSLGVTTTAPSSGRSIVPSDEVPEELHDEVPEAPALLPRHLEYLMSMNVDEKELAILAEWLITKLGRSYRYAAADGSFVMSCRDLKLSHPCLIFSDGIVLSQLVRILSYHKCSQLDTVQNSPKSVATKRNNIRKVLEFLRTEKKTLVDYVFLEDVLVTGDLRAVVLVLRSLKQAYKNHITSSK